MHSAGFDLFAMKWAKAKVGFDILVHAKNDIVSSAVLQTANWEVDRTKAIELHHEAIGGGPYKKTFLDVGANLGVYVIPCMERCHCLMHCMEGWHTLTAASRGYKVTALEAMTQNAMMLNMSLCMNPGWCPSFITAVSVNWQVTERCCIFCRIGREGDTGEHWCLG